MKTQTQNKKSFSVTRNACKLCAPLGASVVFRGIEGAMPFLHGSQGCATYIRRYMISHFREPMDIASSSFTEETAIFGGKENLKSGLKNVYSQYKPQLIGVATTCLSETIGDDVGSFLRELKEKRLLPEHVEVVHVSSPSFKGTHMDGFYAAVRGVVKGLCKNRSVDNPKINIFPSFLSCADLRHLKEIFQDFGLGYIMLPDYSDTLDGPAWDEYHKIPKGGTTVNEIRLMSGACASIEFSLTVTDKESAAKYLYDTFGILNFNVGIPVGIKQADNFFSLIEKITGRPTPEKYTAQRGRLIDAYVDAHKYLFGKKAVVYGDEDVIVALVSFLSEIGVEPVLCVCGSNSHRLKQALEAAIGEAARNINIKENSDFMDLDEELNSLKPDILIGNSKGYPSARRLKIPLVRVFFPIHDRIGGQRLLHIGYEGTMRLFDEVVNALLSKKQEDSSVGYAYL